MKHVITIATVCVVLLACYFAVTWSVPAGSAPQAESAILPISAESTCPVAGCVAAECHAAVEPPTPDGTFTMICPDAGCTSVECHAWEALAGHYHNPNNLSLDAWIMFPTVLLIALIAFVKRSDKRGDAQ